MALLDKYKELLSAAKALMGEDMQFVVQNDLLHIRGVAPNAEAKNKLWDIYSQIDPNFISGEVILNVDVSPSVKGCRARLIGEEQSLNIRKGPSVELPIIGNVEKDEVITVVCRANQYWWLIRAHDFEGYCYAQNIELM